MAVVRLRSLREKMRVRALEEIIPAQLFQRRLFPQPSQKCFNCRSLDVAGRIDGKMRFYPDALFQSEHGFELSLPDMPAGNRGAFKCYAQTLRRCIQ